MTPPGVVSLGSTFVPQTAAAATPKPAVATPRTPVVVTTPTPAAQAPPTPMSAPSTTTAVPTTLTAGQTTTPRRTTQAPLPKGSLLCTLQAGFKRSTYMFPPDGLCTIITFDSVYKSGYTLAPPYKEDFQYFLDTSMQAKHSEFGIGIEQE
nr:mucin-7-like [Dermacentor andersoni]